MELQPAPPTTLASRLKPLLRVASGTIGAGLFTLSCFGFKSLGTSTSSLESRTSLGCLCFLGACFGLLLTFGESTWEQFFSLFGFMRYRLGRAIVFGVSGVMTAILGKNEGSRCDCTDYGVLVAEGVACIVMAALQLLAILRFGNNSAPKRVKVSTAAAAMIQSSGSKSKLTALQTTQGAGADTSLHAVVRSQQIQGANVAPVPAPAPAPVEEKSAVPDDGLPAWMHGP